MIVLRAGFIPLVDSAVLVVAARQGFAAAEGLQLELTREASWATLRDKLGFGALDCAHLLAPIPVASMLQIGNPKPPLVALMSLSMNGNAISVSPQLFDAMRESGRFKGPGDLTAKAAALADVIASRAQRGEPPLTFATVYPFSPHTYELRYLFGAAGIDPDRELELVVVPPPYVVDHMQRGLIDGFCVGAPWTSVGLREGVARVIATKSQIWSRGPEKVLGVRQDFAEMQGDTACRLIRAATRAAAWADDPQNHAALSELLAEPDVLDLDPAIIREVLDGRVPVDDGPAEPDPDYIVFHRDCAGFPWRSHALWTYAQMVRWGEVAHTAENARAAASAYRPDLYRTALDGLGMTLPAANAKVEGSVTDAHPGGSTTGRLILPTDRFFDGRVFDPDAIEAYVAGFGDPVTR